LVFYLIYLSLFAQQCISWGEDGHKMIAQIAANMLNPTAQGIVTQFIGSSTLADIAPLPDTYAHTTQGAWSEPCHYVNMPKGATNFTYPDDCPGPCCVVSSIYNYTKLLSEQQTNPTPCDIDDDDAEPCPLEFLVHFVGDVHQPLHVGFGYDEGGNEVAITFFGQDMNLHHCWDTGIIDYWNSDWSSAASELENMIGNETAQVTEYEGITSPVDWADESFHYVLNTCYNFTDNGETQFVKNYQKTKSNINIIEKRQTVPALGQKYYDVNLPIIQQRLIAAGVRLGTLLNAILTGV